MTAGESEADNSGCRTLRVASYTDTSAGLPVRTLCKEGGTYFYRNEGMVLLQSGGICDC